MGEINPQRKREGWVKLYYIHTFIKKKKTGKFVLIEEGDGALYGDDRFGAGFDGKYLLLI